MTSAFKLNVVQLTAENANLSAAQSHAQPHTRTQRPRHWFTQQGCVSLWCVWFMWLSAVIRGINVASLSFCSYLEANLCLHPVPSLWLPFSSLYLYLFHSFCPVPALNLFFFFFICRDPTKLLAFPLFLLTFADRHTQWKTAFSAIWCSALTDSQNTQGEVTYKL